jgi:hypothetical protein
MKVIACCESDRLEELFRGFTKLLARAEYFIAFSSFLVLLTFAVRSESGRKPPRIKSVPARSRPLLAPISAASAHLVKQKKLTSPQHFDGGVGHPVIVNFFGAPQSMPRESQIR